METSLKEIINNKKFKEDITSKIVEDGDFDNALDQFQFALSLSGNSFQTSETIMTKIKFVQSRLAKRRGI